MSWATQLAAANRAVMGLGGPVIYTPAGGDAATVVGIFDAAYELLDAGHPGLSSTAPAVFLQLADLPVAPEDADATITVDGTEYEVAEIQRDGVGGVVLVLRRAADDA